MGSYVVFILTYAYQRMLTLTAAMRGINWDYSQPTALFFIHGTGAANTVGGVNV